jgi:signal transduction histidine kinase
MLEDLSAHILDIAQNSVAADASRVEVRVRRRVERAEARESGFWEFEIADDGKGMDAARAAAVLSPFCTSRTTRRVGMGLPFLKQNAELCGGRFSLTSEPGKGTRVFASFALDNIDTPPLGDLAETFFTLLLDAPRVRWVFGYETLDRGEKRDPFELSSEEIAEAVGGLEALQIPDVGVSLKAMMRDALSKS